MAALMTRFVRAWLDREGDQKLIAEANKRVEAATQQVNRVIEAFKVFDLTVGPTESWEAVKTIIGDDLYDHAIAEGHRPALALEIQEPNIEEGRIEQSSPNATLFEASIAPPTVRDGALTMLRGRGDGGAKASEIRAFLESTYSMKLHEKTVGMTLYRLSQDGVVRRVGRTWFFVPQSAGTKNPGGETPGLVENEILR